MMKVSSSRLVQHLLMTVLASTVALLTVSCSGESDDPLSPGGSVSSSDDAKHTFDKLMKRPDIDQATRKYEQMQNDIRNSLSRQESSLSEWRTRGESDGMAACDTNSYPGSINDASVNALPNYVATGKFADNKYDRVLKMIGSIVEKYGFNPKPQRIYDAKGVHDVVFHNVQDDGKLQMHFERGVSLGVTTGCYLTAEAKKRGHPSG